MNKEINRYLKDIKLLMPAFGKEEKEYYRRLKENILKVSNGDESYEDIVEKIGTPNELISSYIDEIDSKVLIMKMKKQKWIRYIGITIIVIIAILGVLRSYYLHDLYEDVKNSQPMVVEEIIEEE